MSDKSSPLLLPETSTIDPMLPAGPQVFDLLKRAILTMQLAPGQALSEPEIGGLLGVSRTPVREAFAQLRALYLVETRPSRGSFVTKLNAGNLREAQFLRETLEVGNVQRVIERGLKADVRDILEQNIAAQDHAVRAENHLGFHALDDAFHAVIADGTGFPRAALVLHHEKAQLDRLRVISLNDPARLRTLHAEHAALFQAIIAQDIDLATGLAKDHLRAVLDLLDSVADQNAAFFDTV
jgi:DNA-binding GntR family transcriptional regulator